MRILQFIESGGPGGAEKVVLELSKGLLDRGHEVTVATTREGWLTERLDEYSIKRISVPGRNPLQFVLSIRSLLLNEKIDLIQSHLLDSNFYCSLASWLSQVPHIATEHGDVHHPNKKKHIGMKLKAIRYSPSTISAVSHYTKDALLSFGMDDCLVIPNPVSPVTKTSETKLRDSLNIPDSAWVWAHVANFRPVKDQETLLRSFIRSLEKVPHQHLVIIGDGALRKTLEGISKTATDHIHFLGFQSNVQELLEHCNGFILSSLSEAMPMSIIEAMMSKLVVVSTNVGGIPEIIQDGENGFLFNPRDIQSLSTILSQISNNPEAFQNISESAYQKCVSSYSLSKVLDTYEREFQKKLRPRSKNPQK